jgi:beta-glucosidase
MSRTSKKQRMARLGVGEQPEAHLGALPPVEFGADDKFPKSFIFGVAASSFQIEGDGGDRPRSVWDEFADQNDLGDEARAGIRHYDHYAGDVRYMADAGVQHYRLSLSWPRLMNPDLTPNEEGYAFYRKLLAEVKSRGITPYVTLFHWDLPSFLCERTPHAQDAALGAVDPGGADYGGACAGAWLDPGIVQTFALYARHAFERLGSSVHFWATLNEPKTVVNLGYGTGAHAPGISSATAPLVAAHNMLLAHAAAARVYRQEFQSTQGGAVTLVVNCDWREPQDPDSAEDVAAASRAMEEEMGWFADPLYMGDYPASMRGRYGDLLPRFTPEQSALLKGSADYFALNHYSSRYVKAAGLSPANSHLGRAVDWVESETALDGTPIGPDASSVWLKQVPWGLRKTLIYIKDRYGNPPTYVTENGVSVNPPPGATLEEQLNDGERVAFMRAYLAQAVEAVKGGCDVRGYFHWSFFDNFEWSEGVATRFGMVHVDFKGEFGGEWMRRRAKSSLKAYREFMAGEHSKGGGEGSAASLGGASGAQEAAAVEAATGAAAGAGASVGIETVAAGETVETVPAVETAEAVPAAEQLAEDQQLDASAAEALEGAAGAALEGAVGAAAAEVAAARAGAGAGAGIEATPLGASEPLSSLYVYPVYPLATLGDGVGDAKESAEGAEGAEVVEGAAGAEGVEGDEDARDARRAEVRRRAVAALGRSYAKSKAGGGLGKESAAQSAAKSASKSGEKRKGAGAGIEPATSSPSSHGGDRAVARAGKGRSEYARRRGEIREAGRRKLNCCTHSLKATGFKPPFQ